MLSSFIRFTKEFISSVFSEKFGAISSPNNFYAKVIYKSTSLNIIFSCG